MWSPDARAIARFALVAGLALSVAGCFRPVYGDQGGPAVAKSGPGVEAALKSVSVTPIDGRVGGKMRNELIFLLRGGAGPGPVAYRLDVRMVRQGQSPVVDPFTGVPETRSISLLAEYVLKPVGRIDPVLTGTTFATASYSSTLQRFANIRAERDAEDRAATQIAERIRTHLQGHFATGR
jgi:LPS-assembly lipoprotein